MRAKTFGTGAGLPNVGAVFRKTIRRRDKNLRASPDWEVHCDLAVNTARLLDRLIVLEAPAPVALAEMLIVDFGGFNWGRTSHWAYC
jgi:hypothetical protein